MDTSPEARLRELGIEIPEPAPSVANYIGAVRVGELLFVSGHGPYQNGEYVYLGKLGRDLDVAAGPGIGADGHAQLPGDGTGRAWHPRSASSASSSCS